MNSGSMKKMLFGIVLTVLATQCWAENRVDLVIVSFDRPLQLYALLESVQKFVTGLSTVSVIYRVSNNEYDDVYTILKNEFDTVSFIKQGRNPRQDFKPLLLSAAFDSPSPYILFAVDDNVVKDFVNLNQCVDLLEKTNAWGFYLRLGKNITISWQKPSKVPVLESELERVYSWQFCAGVDDWAYPNNVDMTLYRKKDIKEDLCSLPYTSPNLMEGNWHTKTVDRDKTKKGVCFEWSKIVNIPMNLVQKDWANPHMNVHSAQDLLRMFVAGNKLDIDSISSRNNSAVHDFDYKPVFIKR